MKAAASPTDEGPRTLVHEIVQSKLAPSDKSFERVYEEIPPQQALASRRQPPSYETQPSIYTATPESSKGYEPNLLPPPVMTAKPSRSFST